MKNKNLALVAVLFTISVIMAFANGPAPLVTIDTDQIVDGAVTAIKTDGSLMLSDGSNAVDPVELKNASFTGDIDVTGDVGAATVNGVAPLTAAEKTQALVGSSTVNFTLGSGSVILRPTAITASDTIGYQNSWVDFDTSRAVVIWKDAQNMVHMEGLAKGGTLNDVAFTLPVGYRPLMAVQFAVPTGTTSFGVVNVSASTGNVTFYGTVNTNYNVNGVMFRSAE